MEAVIGRPAAAVRATLLVRLGVLLGLIMPVLNAALYPTYMHQMQPAWAEWTRLLELPFVACELLVVHVAIRRGYDDAAVWRLLPRDIRWAVAVLLVGLTVSSVLVSRNPAVSVALSLITLVHLRFAAAVFFLSGRERAPDVDALFRWLGAGLAVLAVLTALKFAFPPPAALVPGGRIEWPAAMPGFISVRHLGSWSGAVAAGLMVALLYGRRDRATALLYLLAAGITCWSGTRAAVLAMGVAGLVTLVTLRRWPERGALALVAALSLAALAVGIALAPPGLSEFSLFARDNLGSADAMTSGRLELWRQTFARWQDAPVFGWGSGSTFWEVYVGWTHTQPHNAVLQFLISWGLVGAAGALWLLGRAIGAVHAHGFRDPALRPLAATLYALLVMSLLEGMLHYPRFIALEMVGFAVILAARRRASA